MSRVSSPSLSISLKMARNRQTVTEQLVDGLVMGAMLGPGLLIEGREADRIMFKKAGGFFHMAPDRGELLISDDKTGETKIECRIWCPGLVWRSSLLAVGIGLPLGAWLGWQTTLGSLESAICTGVFVGVFGFVRRLMEQSRLKHQLEAYMHNLIYLKAM